MCVQNVFAVTCSGWCWVALFLVLILTKHCRMTSKHHIYPHMLICSVIFKMFDLVNTNNKTNWHPLWIWQNFFVLLPPSGTTENCRQSCIDLWFWFDSVLIKPDHTQDSLCVCMCFSCWICVVSRWNWRFVVLYFPDDFKRGKVNETDQFSALEETLF